MKGAPRKYRYVSYKSSSRGKAGWVAQVRQKGKQVTLGGVYNSQEEAAKIAAKLLKVSTESLLIPKKKPSASKSGLKAKRLKRYIYPHGGSKFFVAKCNDYLGTYDSLAEAEAAAADAAGLEGPEELDLKGSSPQDLLERIGAMYPVYREYDPPDLANLAEECKLSSGLWGMEPALAFLSAAGKYGPWRAQLRLQAGKARLRSASAPGPPDVQSRVAQLGQILHQTVKSLQGVACLTCLHS